MKRLALASAMLAFVLALAACTQSSFGAESDESGVRAEAVGHASGTATGNITIEDGYGIAINTRLEGGSFDVSIANSDGVEVWSGTRDNNVAPIIDTGAGDFTLTIEAKSATGTLEIIPADLEAQRAAGATLEEAIVQETGKTAEEWGISTSNIQSASSAA